METLKELITGHKLPQHNEDEQQLARNIDRLMSVHSYEFEQDKIKSAIYTLANNYLQAYLRNRLGKKYPRLSDDLFELEREVTPPLTLHPSRSQDDYEVEKVQIPVLALVNYGDSRVSYERKTNITRKGGYGTETCAVKISAPVPLLTHKVKEDAGEAMAYALDVCAGALRDAQARWYISRALKNTPPESGLIEVLKPRLEVLWKPRLEDFVIEVEIPEPRERDPALLLNVDRDRYLVSVWDVVEEEPLKHYLSEFTAPKQGRLGLKK